MKTNVKDEEIKISFLGFKYEGKNPTNKSVVIAVVIVIFLLMVAVLAPQLLLQGITKGILKIGSG